MLIESPPTATVLYVENGVGFGGAVISLRTCLEHVDQDRYRSVLLHSLKDEKFASFDGIAETAHILTSVPRSILKTEISIPLNLKKS